MYWEVWLFFFFFHLSWFDCCKKMLIQNYASFSLSKMFFILWRNVTRHSVMCLWDLCIHFNIIMHMHIPSTVLITSLLPLGWQRCLLRGWPGWRLEEAPPLVARFTPHHAVLCGEVQRQQGCRHDAGVSGSWIRLCEQGMWKILHSGSLNRKCDFSMCLNEHMTSAANL